MSAESVTEKTSPASSHRAVMEDEVAEYLRADSSRAMLMFDGTFGGGGHTLRMLSDNSKLCVIACDQDLNAVNRGQKRLVDFNQRLQIRHAAYSKIKNLLNEVSLNERNWASQNQLTEPLRFARVLLDLGISSHQLDDPTRGFSFKNDAALDMRMNQSCGKTAAEILNGASFAELLSMFRRGGLRDRVRELADAVIHARPLKTARDFTTVCERVFSTGKALRDRKGKSHPATVPFQALRIAVNDEIGELERFLKELPNVVEPGARCAFICFHSLEDQVLTKKLREWAQPKEINPTTGERRALGKLLTKKALLPSKGEAADNSRARSARLRVFEFGEELGLWQ